MSTEEKKQEKETKPEKGEQQSSFIQQCDIEEDLKDLDMRNCFQSC